MIAICIECESVATPPDVFVRTSSVGSLVFRRASERGDEAENKAAACRVLTRRETKQGSRSLQLLTGLAPGPSRGRKIRYGKMIEGAKKEGLVEAAESSSVRNLVFSGPSN